MSSKREDVERFFSRVSQCTKCHAEHGIVVPPPDPMPDPASVHVLLLGEQPDRSTAEKGPRGLDADPSLEILRSYVETSGIDQDTMFYTPAILCLPKQEGDRPKRPSAREVRHCSTHLQSLLNHLRPTVVVPLGHTAVQALQWAWPDWSALRQFILNYDVGSFLERNGVAVYPLYFPSEATLKARGESRQRRDWARLAQVIQAVERNAPTS